MDYGARFYDPAICRFSTIDPKAEEYNFQTPYAYAANDPIKHIDQNGENPIVGALVWGYRAYRAYRLGRAAREIAKELTRPAPPGTSAPPAPPSLAPGIRDAGAASDVLQDFNDSLMGNTIVEGKDNRHVPDDTFDQETEDAKVDGFEKALEERETRGGRTKENTKGKVDKDSVEGATEQLDGLDAAAARNRKAIETNGKSEQRVKNALKNTKID